MGLTPPFPSFFVDTLEGESLAYSTPENSLLHLLGFLFFVDEARVANQTQTNQTQRSVIEPHYPRKTPQIRYFSPVLQRLKVEENRRHK